MEEGVCHLVMQTSMESALLTLPCEPTFGKPTSVLRCSDISPCSVRQVKVVEELAAATAQVSRLQLELTAHQKEEMDLRAKLTTALQEAETYGAQLNKLQAQLAGKEWDASGFCCVGYGLVLC